MSDSDSRTGGRYANAQILQFAAAVHAPHDQALQEAFEAPEREGMPAIQVSPSEARLLELLMRLAGARKVVEVGTLAGFSAIRMARALPDDGHLWTIEFDARHAAVARERLAAAGFAERATVLEGRAAEVLPTLEPQGPFDAVFVDADKSGYAEYGRWAARNLRPGGLLIADNAYYFGRLLNTDDPGAASVRQLHEEAPEAFESVCIPTPDGLLLGIRR